MIYTVITSALGAVLGFIVGVFSAKRKYKERLETIEKKLQDIYDTKDINEIRAIGKAIKKQSQNKDNNK